MTDLPTTTRQWVMKEMAGDVKVSYDNFELQSDIPIFDDTPTDGKLLIQVTHISTDPGQRNWMDGGGFNVRSYMSPDKPVLSPGQKVLAIAVGRVLRSYGNSEYAAGDLVIGPFGWTEYILFDPPPMLFWKIPKGMSPEHGLTLLLTASTSYFSFMKVGKPDKETTKTIVVSGAAGGVGIVVAQLAKRVVSAERVIGIVGSDEKAKKLLELGYVDIALNYKAADFDEKFTDATPNYVDLFFDNVGGHILDLNLRRIAPHGKIVVCGAVSHYEGDEEIKFTAEAWMQIVYQRVSILGYLMLDHLQDMDEMVENLTKWQSEGKLDIVTDVKDLPFDKVPDGFISMMAGNNFGKNIIKVA